MHHTHFLVILLAASSDLVDVRPTSLFTRTPFSHTMVIHLRHGASFPLLYSSSSHTEKLDAMNYATALMNEDENRKCCEEREL